MRSERGGNLIDAVHSRRHDEDVPVTSPSPIERGGDHTARKRQQLLDYTRTHLVPHTSVFAVIAVGSVAAGLARADSDIDAVVFMDPLDLYVAPAEAIWRPDDDTYHSIFSTDPDLDGIQLDFTRLDLSTWRDPAHRWPEHTCAALADGWLVFDRSGQVSALLAERTSMSNERRRQILDEVLVAAAGLLRQDPGSVWASLPAAEAFDRLQTAYEELVRGLFAYNHKWRPWRGRALRSLSGLAYLPRALSDDLEGAVRTSGDGLEAYSARSRLLGLALDQLIDQLHQDDDYGPDAVSEAFIRLHDEPGRAWNIADWSINRTQPSKPGPARGTSWRP